MRQKILSGLTLLALTAGGGVVWADDSDIFLEASTTAPNVVILIDTSGSMSNTINGVRKIDTAKSVVANLLNTVSGVRFGIMAFNSESTGASMVAEVGTDTATMVTAVNGLSASGWTPLGRSAQNIDAYYRGTFVVGGSSGGGGGDDDDDDDDDGSPSTPAVTYPSPIQSECQLNYAILITDGMPTGENENLVAQTATTLYTTDHSSTLRGMQTVTVHTIGFAVPEGRALLTQTATNGGGSFYEAANATELAAALASALQQVITDNYSFGSPLVPSTGVTGGTRAYLASFQTSLRPFWKGFLKAHQRGADGSVAVDANGVPTAAVVWEAGAVLAAKSSSTRTLYTYAAGARQAFTKANATITRTLLGVSTNAIKDQVVDFIRGIDSYDEDGDGNVTEEREWKLGDIFHASPVLVYPPPARGTESSYVSFRQANAGRTTIVLAGANDGMLHAFRESDGEELWGFIPPNVLGNLKDLTTAAGVHPYYVDGTPMVADVQIGGAWKTIAVFGQRRGGDAYYALDITDTTNPLYLWSFTDSEITETWSVPAIGKVLMADGTRKYVAFVGGGYNTASNNAKGRGFFVIDLANGSKLWQYKVGPTNDKQFMNFSIPTSPTAVDLTGDDLVDFVYVNDVGGQIWKFDVSAAATVAGSLVTNWTGKRLFNASTTQANPPAVGEFHATRAMYGSPDLAKDTSGVLWVYVGTGDRNHPNDASQDRFYGIKDNTDMTNGAALTEAALADSTSGTAVTQGWYLRLAAYEKVLASATVYNGVVFFTTYTSAAGATACQVARGTASLYGVLMGNGRAGVDWSTGQYAPASEPTTARSKTVGTGIPSAPVITAGSEGDGLVVSTTDEQLSNDTLPRRPRKQIHYWREVF